MRTPGVIAINVDSDHPAHRVFLQRVHTSYRGNMVVVGVLERANHVVFATKGMAISAKTMGLERALDACSQVAQLELTAEFQRIAQRVDDGSRFLSIDALGTGG